MKKLRFIILLLTSTWALNSNAMLSFGVNCNGISWGWLTMCFTYSWSGTCNDGSAVGGNQEYPEQCASDAASQCAGHGGFVAAQQCPPGYSLQNEVCIKQVWSHGGHARLAEKTTINVASTHVTDNFCQYWNKWACGGKCIDPRSACGTSCSSRRSLSSTGSCELVK